MEYLDSFGDWLRQRREALRLTRPELANCAGCSVSALRKIEADERRPSRQLAKLLAECLRIPSEEQPLFLDAARGVRPVARLGRPAPRVLPKPFPSPPVPSDASSRNLAGRSTWNLPSPATPLIGREAELATLAQLLDDPDCRLLTLVGPGGIGKSRLALEAACQQWDAFAGGVFFIPLASVSSPEHLVPAVAQAIGLNFAGPAEPRVQLVNYLRNKQMLLLLDNLEHLLEGVDVLVELLASAPGVKLLVTSRERLDMSGEWVFDVQGLPVPPEGEVAELEKYSAAQLFLQRARQAQLDFELPAEVRPDIVRICHLVEGMPLALQLAAAWVTVLSCSEIADEIERGLDILSTQHRDVPERQRSLQAVFDHSWKLLPQNEQSALCQLSLFRGGFQREAAQTVARANLSLISKLISKSLIRRRGNRRYDMHELIRQCALEHLQVNAKLWTAARKRFDAYYLELANSVEVGLKGDGQLEWLQRMEGEYNNARAVLEMSLRDESAEADNGNVLALELAAALRWFWHMRGNYHEGRDWLLKLLKSYPDQRTVVCARALEGASLLTNALGEHEAALGLAEESMAIYRELGNRQGLASALTIGGASLRWQGNIELGNAWQREALALHREEGDRWGTALNLYELGRNLADFGGDESGHVMLEESAAILEELGDKYVLTGVLISLGIIAIGQADFTGAHRYFERGLAIAREIGDPSYTADTLANLGYVLRVQGDHTTARAHFEAALRIYQKGGNPVWEIDPLCALAENDTWQGNLVAARSRLVDVCARPETMGNKWLQVLTGYLQGILAYYEGDTGQAARLLEETITLARQGGYKPDLARALVALGRAENVSGRSAKALALLQEGLGLFQELGHKLGMVTALEGLAELGTEDATQAVRLLASSAATREAIGAPLPAVEHPLREGLIASIRTGLAEEEFAHAWSEGELMSLDEATVYGLLDPNRRNTS